jgi:predicted GNAT superfamily acetyltransferase
MISFSTSVSKDELQGILDLQAANLAINLNAEDIHSQGFVTVSHTYDQLKKLNDYERHIVAKQDDRVIGYLLAMTENSKSDIPVLVPMFDMFKETFYKNKSIADYNYIVVGQVCIAKQFRGQGILDNCYAAYKDYYSPRYDFAITEIATTNTRSLNAHKRVGFKEIKSYTSGTQVWVIVLWDWNS